MLYARYDCCYWNRYCYLSVLYVLFYLLIHVVPVTQFSLLFAFNGTKYNARKSDKDGNARMNGGETERKNKSIYFY